ncbi:hypothetical protein HK101_001420 [Irineochytrium annulatum]|nr:hypothetical protein HK101_001420 [Irineochytrium annulatum]
MQKHRNCSEPFYRSNVIGELESRKADESDKKKVMEILRRFEAEGADDALVGIDDADDDEDEEERVEKMTLEELLESMNMTERAEFERTIRRGDIPPDWIDVREPWWCHSGGEVSTDSDASDTRGGESSAVLLSPRAPPVLEDVTPFSLLSRNPPSKNLRYDLIDVLFAYAIAWRHMDGEISSDGAGGTTAFCALIWEVSRTLSDFSRVEYESAEEAVCVVRDRSVNVKSMGVSSETVSFILGDVVELLRHDNTLAALSDMYRVFCEAATSKVWSKEMRRKAFATSKKLYFHISFCGTVRFMPDVVEVLQRSRVKMRMGLSHHPELPKAVSMRSIFRSRTQQPPPAPAPLTIPENDDSPPIACTPDEVHPLRLYLLNNWD